MKSLTTAAGLALAVLVIPAQAQQTRGDYYRAGYFLLGSYLRASNVCDNMNLAKYGFSFVSSPEFRAFSKAYPDTYKQWMKEGGENFNSMVMKDGIPAACRAATEMMARKAGR